MNIYLTLSSTNKKTGPIPVSTTSSETCPSACPFNNPAKPICYAMHGPLWFRWLEVTSGQRGGTWSAFLERIRALPAGTLWRHNQAGDLPGQGDTLDTIAFRQLVVANAYKRGFTYTHKPLRTKRERKAIANANRDSFTVNLSANDLAHADTLADLEVGPVVTVLPASVQGKQDIHTPAGRRVVVCPATYRDDITCKSCGLCAIASREVIVGFPAHGAGRRHMPEAHHGGGKKYA